MDGVLTAELSFDELEDVDAGFCCGVCPVCLAAMGAAAAIAALKMAQQQSNQAKPPQG
jgi:hypothetical protein